MKLNRLAALPLALVILMTACGVNFLSLLATARAVTAAATPGLDRLVQRGVITAAQKASIQTFLSATTSNLDVTHTEWVAAGGDKAKEAAVVQGSVNREATAVSGLVALPVEAQAIIDDVSAAFAIIGAFYGATVPPSMRLAPGASITPMSAKDMEAQVKARIEALKQKLQ
jgi:hypothetical protein